VTKKQRTTATIRRPSRLLRSLAQAAVIGTLLSTLPAVSTAQSNQDPAKQEQEPKWYQVEVIIFERLPGNQAGDTEAWPKDIELAYPANWQKLIAPEQAMEMVAALEEKMTPAGQAEKNAARDETILAAVPQTDATSEGQAIAVPEGQNAMESELSEPLPPILNTGALPELAFVKLPEAKRTLNESKNAIARDRALRVLFHEAWRQPIVSAEDAPAIIISGGNTYGDHAELEGTLRLSVSRYLHLNTNLWHTHFIPNYGQEPEHWPTVPPVPVRVPERNAAPEELESETAVQVVGEEGDALWRFDLTAPIDDYTNLIDQPFLIQEIITLRQTRRMRSGELHYIDHPRLGLLIKVDPYKPEPAKEVR
jgi:hypothetical protein